MKKLLLSILPLLSLTPLSNAQVAGKICNWSNDKRAAVALSFDDWSPGHFPIVVPELSSRNLTATFFVMNSTISNWGNVQTTASNGNEIGNHTKTHPNLTTKTPVQLNDEIRGMKTLIDQNITTQKTRAFAYPFGNYNSAIIDSIKNAGHISARTVNPPSANYSYNFAPTENDYFKILTYAMSGSVSTSTYNTQVQNIINGGGFLTFLYHSVDNSAGTYNDNWYSKVLQDSLQKQLDLLVSLQNAIWVTTFTKAILYHKEKNCATLSQIQAPDGTSWVINLVDTLKDNFLYKYPLTLKLKVNGIAYDHVTQNGNSLSFSITNDTIQFDAIPDAGEIALSVGALASNEAPTLDAITNVVINQNAGIQTINLSGITAGGTETQSLSVSATSLNNSLTQSLSINYTSPASTGTLSFSPNAAAAGYTTIIVKVTDGGIPARITEQRFTVTVNAVASTIQNSKLLSDDIITIVPNPSNGLFSFHTKEVLNNVSITIEDCTGAQLQKNKYTTLDQLSLDLSENKAGVYYLRIESDQGYSAKKILLY